MQIECENCGTGYDLQVPPAAKSGGRNLKFRCAACGHSFLVMHADGSRPEPTGAVVPRGYRVEEGASSRQVPDLATLQRMVASREVGPAARVTDPNGVTLPAQGVPELSIFFDLVHRAERVGGPHGEIPAGPRSSSGTTDAARPDTTIGADLGDLSWLDASVPSALEPETEALDVTKPARVEEGEVTPSASGGVAESSASAPRTSAMDDLSWLDAPDRAPGAGESDAVFAPDKEAAPADLSWLDPATEAADAPAASSTPDDLSWLDAPASADGASDQGTPAFDEDLAWLMDPALDAPSAKAGGSDGAASWDDPAAAPDGGEELPEEIRNLAAGLAGAGSSGSGTSSSGGVSKAGTLSGPGMGDALWDPELGDGREDDATEEATRSGVVMGDESNTMDLSGTTFAAGSESADDEFDDFSGDRRSGGGRWAAVVVVALCAAGGWWWWNQQQEPAVVPPTAAATVAPAVDPPAPKTPQDAAVPDATDSRKPESKPSAPAAPPVSTPSAAASEKVPPATKKPAKVAAEPPAPPPRKDASAGVRAIVERGWSKVDASSLDDADKLFAQAIKSDPSSGDAHFGAGYVAELRGRLSDAYREYCLAQFHGKGNINLEREVAGRLRAIGRSCD